MTGWGQVGPAGRPGRPRHRLHRAGRGCAARVRTAPAQPPTPPLNVVGDFGGGGLLLAYGIVCALFEASRSGEGQVVDTAMVDGTAMLMAPFYAGRRSRLLERRARHQPARPGAPYYDVYECADGGFLAVGAIEPQFYADLLDGLGLAEVPDLPDRDDRARWPVLRSLFQETFRQRTRDEWVTRFDRAGRVRRARAVARRVRRPPAHRGALGFQELAGVRHPSPAPRLSRTPGAIAGRPCFAGEHTDAVLAEFGFGPDEVASLRVEGVIA